MMKQRRMISGLIVTALRVYGHCADKQKSMCLSVLVDESKRIATFSISDMIPQNWEDAGKHMANSKTKKISKTSFEIGQTI